MRLTEEDFQMYYNGCCNATFWPLFHSMPDRCENCLHLTFIFSLVCLLVMMMINALRSESMIMIMMKNPAHHRAVFDEEYWVGYRKVNEKFAEETLKALRGMDKVASYDDNDDDDDDDDDDEL